MTDPWSLGLGRDVAVLRDARLADGRSVDVVVQGGVITSVEPAGGPPMSTPVGASVIPGPGPGSGSGATLDLAGRLLLPAFVEPHAHLDKALLTLPGTGPGLMAAVVAWIACYPDRTVPEITERATRAAREYVRHGVGTLRTHADAGPLIGTRAVEASIAVRAALHDVVDIQVVAFAGVPITGVAGASGRAVAAAALDAGADLLGGAPWLDPDPAGAVQVLAGLAADWGVGLDLHLDETTDPRVSTLSALLAAVRGGFGGSVTASHVVSLGSLARERQDEVAAELAEALIGVVTLPRTNLWLQEREVRTAPRRGLTAVRSLLDAGVRVAAGTDNLRDAFNPYGQGDPLDVARLLATVAEVSSREALDTVTGGAAQVVGAIGAASVQVRQRADLVVLDVPDIEQALATTPGSRLVLHAGRLVARRILDEQDLVSGRPVPLPGD